MAKNKPVRSSSTGEENQERHRNHPVFGKLYYPTLFRVKALKEDLDYYYLEDGHWEPVPLHLSTKKYIQRTDTLSERWVEGFVAHHYARYLGDLSGGQTLKRIVARMFNLSSGEGLAFYDFSQIPDLSQFKAEYRSQPDSNLVDEAT